MTWSYSGNPANSDIDHIRFKIQDTDTEEQFLQDEEIQFVLDQKGSVNIAAIDCARRIATKFARLVDESVGRVKISLSQRYKQYLEIVAQLEQELATSDVIPFMGGKNISQKESVRSNTDRVRPAFTKDLHDYQEESLYDDCED